ncbi:hypothetical protein ATI61_103580 [Archangium gephyra]|uniref:Uncharacterized protein n=1 Tax=Archangium gephyra TaxID=48 RepID=A0ABX9K7Q6_9BACT|nr:hypothetical protein [Archangium gephyra]REG34673.1 hypothetical protein ATI61_103580 [Archangium gephyra]
MSPVDKFLPSDQPVEPTLSSQRASDGLSDGLREGIQTRLESQRASDGLSDGLREGIQTRLEPASVPSSPSFFDSAFLDELNRDIYLRRKESEHFLDLYESSVQARDEADLRHFELIDSYRILVAASRRAFEHLQSTILRVGIVLATFTFVLLSVNGPNVLFVISLFTIPVGAYCLLESYSALLLWRSTSRLSRALLIESKDANERALHEATRVMEVSTRYEAALLREEEAVRYMEEAKRRLEGDKERLTGDLFDSSRRAR